MYEYHSLDKKTNGIEEEHPCHPYYQKEYYPIRLTQAYLLSSKDWIFCDEAIHIPILILFTTPGWGHFPLGVIKNTRFLGQTKMNSRAVNKGGTVQVYTA